MNQSPRGGLIGKLRQTVQDISDLNIPVHAANTSYFIILSVFPALVLLLSLLRYTDLHVNDLVELLEGVIPTALLPEAEQLILGTYRSTSRAMVGFSAITALWSASRGIYGLVTGLNAIYGVSEDRGYLYTRSISVLYTFLFILVLLLTLVLHVFGRLLLQLLSQSSSPFLRFLTGVVDLRFFLLLFIQTCLFTAMFMALPNRRNSLSSSLPGALLAAIGWLVFSHLYSVYVEYFPTYANVYGSVYAIALSMLWLYFCILIVFYGGLLNRFLMEKP
ncbi:MAG: YihY/virulence factor BrkB family protein [Oscillospiraceae bacterium]|nr:YihY/virulence factor BrkB family protein [Oscillospiraceae bacterium]